MIERVDTTSAAVKRHDSPGNDFDDSGHPRHDLAAVLVAADDVEAEHETLLSYQRQEIGLDLVHTATGIVYEAYHV